MRIGIDIGGVVIKSDGPEDTSFFSDNYLQTPAMPHALTSLRRLAKSHELFFISKAGQKTASKTVEWLSDRAILHKAGIVSDGPQWAPGVPFDRLVFCRKREQKAPIAALLELDIFIDDRLEICDSMERENIHPIWFFDWETAFSDLSRVVEL